MRWPHLLLLIPLAACSSQRTITFTTHPADATLTIDGVAQGPPPVTQKFKFRIFHSDEYHVLASRPGYQDSSLVITKDEKRANIDMPLKPFTRTLSFSVLPVAGIVSINGAPISSDPVTQSSSELEFTKDDHGNWTKYKITAQRPGFQPAEITVTFTDASADYILQLQPMRKDLSINTTPPGAMVTLDDQELGKTPLVDKARAFPFDTATNQFQSHKIKVTKPGYDPLETSISWDDGRTSYQIDLPPKKKTVRVMTVPPGATVTIDGKTISNADDGVATTDLTFVPLNDNGDLPSFTATIAKKSAETEWYPATVNIGWDNSRTDYSVTLKEIKTRPVPTQSVSLERNADGQWDLVSHHSDLLGMKDISEGPGKEPPAVLYQAPRGATIDTLTISPSGSLILFTIFNANIKPDAKAQDIRSQMLAISSDGTGGVREITDGRALDMMPSFTPDGEQIVFCSNRASRRLNIWRKSISGGAGIEQLTNAQEQDLWPTIDALPKPRLFYEALSDTQSDAQLYVAPVDGGPRMDLTTITVNQPRVSPKADSVLFTSVNQRTGNREIYRIPDHGGPPVNLTNDPDSDSYDPAWSREGGQIAYVCDRGMDEDRRRNPDIWILDLSHPDKPIQVTTNGSVDDCPVWDPSGNAIYFRSNRGGQWGIWKISVK